ncbi:MAG: TIR domain-containing protein [Bacilli bacterium]|nr:TIR domain-containing protein [Bacilli bacterium]
MKYLTKGMVNPTGKQKIYFSSCKEDSHLLEEIAKDILSISDVAIYYEKYEKLDDLKLMHLIVFSVTKNFLYSANPSKDNDLKYALENGIPVLPLIQEDGLELEFNKIVGDIQCLNKYHVDETQISFYKKLEEYLNSIFVSDSLRKRIENCFDEKIFLSYRKKDRSVAQRMIEEIHSYESLQSCSIWYDEFLTPGEDYSDNIEQRIKDCSFFVMVVTPSLLEKDNYILRIEYPLARKYNKQIIVLEGVETSFIELSKLYENIPMYSKVENIKSLVNIDTNSFDREKNYLLGQAYLSGVEVEINVDRAIDYLTKASEQNHIESLVKLSSIYFDGRYIKEDVSKAVDYIKKASILSRMVYARNKTIDNFEKMADYFDKWGTYLFNSKQYEISKSPYLLMNAECLVAKKYLDPEFVDMKLAYSFERMGDADYKRHQYEEAKRSHEKAYDLLVKDGRVNRNFLRVASLLEKLAKDAEALQDAYYLRAYTELRVSTLSLLIKDNNDFESYDMYYRSLYELGRVFYLEGDYKKALDLLSASIDGYKSLYNKSHLNDDSVQYFFAAAPAFLLIGKINSYKGNTKRALEIFDYLSNNYKLIFQNNLERIEDILSDLDKEYGLVLMEEKRYEEALVKLLEASKIEKKLMQRKTLSNTYQLIDFQLTLARCYVALNDYQKVELSLTKVLMLFKAVEDKESPTFLKFAYATNTLLANLYEHKGMHDLVENCLIKAVVCCRKANKENTVNTDRFIDLLNAYAMLGNYYEKVNNNEKVFECFNVVYNNALLVLERTDDILILNKLVDSVFKLISFYKEDYDKLVELLDNGIKASIKIDSLAPSNLNTFCLGELYLFKATINKEDIDLELVYKSKELLQKVEGIDSVENILNSIDHILSLMN